MNKPVNPGSAVADKTWRDNAMVLALLYLIEEQGKRFSTALDSEQRFLDDPLTQMYQRDLLEIDGDATYVITDKGRKVLEKMVAMYDQVRQFEVFAAFNLEDVLPEGERNKEDPNRPHDNLYDLRFKRRSDSVDMRLAVMTFISETMPSEIKVEKADPFLIVFMQQVADGRLAADDFLPRLRDKSVFTEVEAIVNSAYRWQSAGDTVEESTERMHAIYTAGMVERLKREGQECAKCRMPLAVFEEIAKSEGEGPLQECPDPECRCSFAGRPPAAATVTAEVDGTCPRCGEPIRPTHAFCRGCHAEVDRTLRPGAVEAETEVWTHEYVLEPVYYDPFDPFLVGTAFCLGFHPYYVC